MKLNRLETHDRLLHFNNQSEDMGKGISECIANVPEAIKCPFYVYGFGKLVGNDEKVSLIIQGQKRIPSERMIWVPRISKPRASPNSYLFLARKGTDVVETIWMLPRREYWDQYNPGQLFHNEGIWTSIQNYRNCLHRLNAPDVNGPNPKDVELFIRIMGEEAHKRKANEINSKCSNTTATGSC